MRVESKSATANAASIARERRNCVRRDGGRPQVIVGSNLKSRDHYQVTANRAHRHRQIIHLWGDHVFGNGSYPYNYIAVAQGISAIGRDSNLTETFGGSIPIIGVRRSLNHCTHPGSAWTCGARDEKTGPRSGLQGPMVEIISDSSTPPRASYGQSTRTRWAWTSKAGASATGS